MKATRTRGHGGPKVDPVALLKREHNVILEQLRMIETAIAPRGAGNGAMSEPDRETLRDLLRFFTGRVGVHFKRESLLIAALQRILTSGQNEREQFRGLLDEHRALKADAAEIAKKLKGKPMKATLAGESDPFGIRSFIKSYRGHISWEERVLFVLAEMRLTAEQKQRISHRMLHV